MASRSLRIARRRVGSSFEGGWTAVVVLEGGREAEVEGGLAVCKTDWVGRVGGFIIDGCDVGEVAEMLAPIPSRLMLAKACSSLSPVPQLAQNFM